MMLEFLTRHPLVALALVVLGVAGWYALMCWRYPFTNCLMCTPGKRKDRGRVYQNRRKLAWRNCWWCKGTGRRRRWGRIIWAHVHETKRKAKA